MNLAKSFFHLWPCPLCSTTTPCLRWQSGLEWPHTPALALHCTCASSDLPHCLLRLHCRGNERERDVVEGGGFGRVAHYVIRLLDTVGNKSDNTACLAQPKQIQNRDSNGDCQSVSAGIYVKGARRRQWIRQWSQDRMKLLRDSKQLRVRSIQHYVGSDAAMLKGSKQSMTVIDAMKNNAGTFLLHGEWCLHSTWSAAEQPCNSCQHQNTVNQ